MYSYSYIISPSDEFRISVRAYFTCKAWARVQAPRNTYLYAKLSTSYVYSSVCACAPLFVRTVGYEIYCRIAGGSGGGLSASG